jgi:hypothetical protein
LEFEMALSQERLEYQREYRARTGYAASKKYAAKRADSLESDINLFARDQWHKLRKGASTRGIGWRITLRDFTELLSTQRHCAISGRQVSFRLGDVNKASLDRIDSNKAYDLDNVQIVTTIANMMKRDWIQEDIIALAKDIAKHHA